MTGFRAAARDNTLRRRRRCFFFFFYILFIYYYYYYRRSDTPNVRIKNEKNETNSADYGHRKRNNRGRVCSPESSARCVNDISQLLIANRASYCSFFSFFIGIGKPSDCRPCCNRTASQSNQFFFFFCLNTTLYRARIWL